MSIKAIDQEAVHRINAGQVIVDLQTAVKELVENALDAGATSVEIAFKDQGLESFEVKDNGSGVDEQDWENLAVKHSTSKLASFDDLGQVSTLGFRGEALASLCAMAQLTLVTATSKTAPRGTTLTFEPSGKLSASSSTAAQGIAARKTTRATVPRQKGTTVTVRDLFARLPVRRKELHKNIRREFTKCLALINAYALIRTNTRFLVTNTNSGTKSGKPNVHLQTSPAPSIRSNVTALFTSKVAAQLLDLDLSLAVQADKTALKFADKPAARAPTTVLVKGLISSAEAGAGRSSTDRQFFYLNGRPFDSSKIARAFNEVYKSFTNGSVPFIIADFQLPTDSYDVNVSPDKRTIFIHSEENLVDALKTALETLYQPSRSVFPMTQLGVSTSRTATQKAEELDEEREHAEDEQGDADEHAEDEQGDAVADAVQVSNATRGPSPPVATTSVAPAPPASLSPPASFPVLDTRAAKRSESPVTLDQRPSKRLRLSASPEEQLAAAPLASVKGKATQQPIELDSDEEDEVEAGPAAAQEAMARTHEREMSAEASPEPASAPTQRQMPAATMRQMTLDTTTASWSLGSAATSRSKSDNAPASNGTLSRSALSHLHQFKSGATPGASGSRELYIVGARSGRLGATSVLDSDDEEQESEDEEAQEVTTDQRASSEIDVISDSGPPAAQTTDPADEDESDVEIVESAPMAAKDDEDDEDEWAQERREHLEQLGADDDTDEVDVKTRPEIQDTSLSFDMSRVEEAWARIDASREPAPAVAKNPLEDAEVEGDTEAAERTLSRIVASKDFDEMRVLGQFNLGFILARRSHTPADRPDEAHDDIFIIDQHASDEKKNFEHLQATTAIRAQPLVMPKALHLPSQDELLAIDRSETIKMNGFGMLVDETKPVGERVKLSALPVSKNITFSVDDFEEMLSLLKDASPGELVRPSRTRKMFASRACRMSVMIGKALSHKQMTAIVRNMASLDQPWSCPHGRPTMRWLTSLATTCVDRRQDLQRVVDAYGGILST